VFKALITVISMHIFSINFQTRLDRLWQTCSRRTHRKSECRVPHCRETTRHSTYPGRRG